MNTGQESLDEGSRIILCPYCGRTQPSEHDRCDACGGWFEPLSVKATHLAMGPWYVRDKAQPFRPGCSYEVLCGQIDAGRIKPTTVIRGPTTRQMWSIARNTPGVAHLLGHCHACNGATQPDAQRCPHCGESFPHDHARNDLGLLYPTTAAVAEASEALNRQVTQRQRDSISQCAASPHPAAQGGEDLLLEVLGTGAPRRSDVRPLPTPAPIDPGDDDPDSRAPPHVGDADKAMEEPVAEGRAASIGTLAWCLIVFNGMLLLMIIVLLVIWRNV